VGKKVEPAKPKCLVCDLQATRRGLCTNCYHSARRMVRDKDATWDKLVANGLALPDQRTIGKPRTAFYKRAVMVLKLNK
jgi:hypothetical protein